jgi:hypothetical protein
MYYIVVDCDLSFNGDSGLNRDNRLYYKTELVQKLILGEREKYDEAKEFIRLSPEGNYSIICCNNITKFKSSYVRTVEERIEDK